MAGAVASHPAGPIHKHPNWNRGSVGGRSPKPGLREVVLLRRIEDDDGVRTSLVRSGAVLHHVGAPRQRLTRSADGRSLILRCPARSRIAAFSKRCVRWRTQGVAARAARQTTGLVFARSPWSTGIEGCPASKRCRLCARTQQEPGMDKGVPTGPGMAAHTLAVDPAGGLFCSQ